MKKNFIIFILTLVHGQTLDITFRYIENSNDDFLRIYVPGEMNNWGPNSNGIINPSAPSQMIYSGLTDSYNRTYNLSVGQTYLYKYHFHYNESGSEYSWVPDPLNPNMTDDSYTNSILEITDPLFFQVSNHYNDDGLVEGISAGIFSTNNISIINLGIGTDTLDIIGSYDSDLGVLYHALDPAVSIYESYFLEAVINGIAYTIIDQPSISYNEIELPENIVMGPNWNNNQMVLAIYAPAQPVMQLLIGEVGEFVNNSQAIIMNKATNFDDTWWIELDLPNGTYDYEYLMMNGIRVADPLSRRFEEGKTRIEIGEGGISTADNYQWISNNFTRPNLDTLVIYELHVDDFSAQGEGYGMFLDVIQRLDHIKQSGANAIELLPVTAFPTNHSWGYDPELLSAVESNYGSPEEFKQLVDQAHSKGIAVIMDIVWNHIRPTSPIWKIQPDYNLNPYIKLHSELNPNETEGSWGMLDWDHFKIQTMNYINQVNKIWIDEYRIDGFRFDATQMIGWDMNQPEYGLIGITENISNLDLTFYQIAEHLPVDPWLINNTDFTSGWNDSFHDRLLNDIHGTYVSTATFMQQVIGLNEYSNISNEYEFANQTIKYMVSHDEQSLIQEMTVFNNYDLDQALKMDQFYSILLFTSRGIPMLFQGQEFGLRTGWDDVNNNGDYEEKLQYRPIDWSYLETDDGQSHFNHYSNLARFRKNNPAISKGEFYDLWRYTNERVIVYGYKDESFNNSGDQVVVIANFSNEDQTVIDVPFLSNGQWYNILNEGNNIMIESLNYEEYSIESKSASIFSKNEWNLMVKDESNTTYSNSIEAYPNPFNGRLNINLNIGANSDGILQLYNIKGELVKSWDDGLIRSGMSTINWNPINNKGDNLCSGIYFISYLSSEFNMKKKVIFLK
jgi:1,4-alpha-glucan branching enzyme